MQQKAMNRKDEIDSAKATDTSKDGVCDQKPRFDRCSETGSTCSLFHVRNIRPGRMFSWNYVQSSELQGRVFRKDLLEWDEVACLDE